MYKCNKCKKEFKYESEFNRHKNKKLLCNKIENLECEICNLKFNCTAEKIRHNETKKHINKLKNKLNSNITIIDYKYEYEQLLEKFTILNNEKINANNKIKELELQIGKLENENLSLLNKFNLLEQSSNKELNNTEYI